MPAHEIDEADKDPLASDTPEVGADPRRPKKTYEELNDLLLDERVRQLDKRGIVATREEVAASTKPMDGITAEKREVVTGANDEQFMLPEDGNLLEKNEGLVRFKERARDTKALYDALHELFEIDDDEFNELAEKHESLWKGFSKMSKEEQASVVEEMTREFEEEKEDKRAAA